MKKYAVFLLSALASLNFGASAAETSTDVTVVLKDGSEKVVNVDTTGAISFSGNIVNIVPSISSNALYSYNLSDVRKLMFDQVSGVVRILAQNEILVFPSPASDAIYVANAPVSKSQLAIYNVAGAVVKSIMYNGGDAIDVSTLPSGVYTLKLGNYTSKFEKK